jgi:hypothetical protein
LLESLKTYIRDFGAKLLHGQILLVDNFFLQVATFNMNYLLKIMSKYILKSLYLNIVWVMLFIAREISQSDHEMNLEFSQ